jgi:hypothetical protein
MDAELDFFATLDQEVMKVQYNSRSAKHISPLPNITLQVNNFFVQKRNEFASKISQLNQEAAYLESKQVLSGADSSGPANSFAAVDTSNLQEMGNTQETAAEKLITAAAKDDRIALAELLDDSKCNINAADYDLRSAVHLAAAEGHLQVLHMLAVYPQKHGGAALVLDKKDRFGRTPMMEALLNGYPLYILLLFGASM